MSRVATRGVAWALFTAMLLSTSPANAARVYKFKDETGNWQFTDRPPVGVQQVESTLLTVEPRRRVDVRERRSGDVWVLEASNGYAGPVQLEVAPREEKNVVFVPSLPARFVLPAHAHQDIVHIRIDDPHKSASYKLDYRYVPGPPLETFEATTVYRPPFAEGAEYPISQGFNGTASHQGPQSRYAVDIAMPKGTPVLAARGGVVMEVNDDFHRVSNTNETYKARANSVRVLHNDGTMAIYAHLQVDSTKVYEGIRVRPGHLLALSGNTGYSTGPHLHFAVQVNVGMHIESIPFLFATRSSVAITPKRGMMIEGVPVTVTSR